MLQLLGQNLYFFRVIHYIGWQKFELRGAEILGCHINIIVN